MVSKSKCALRTWTNDGNDERIHCVSDPSGHAGAPRPLDLGPLLSGASPLSSARGEKVATDEWLESLLFRLLVQAAAGIHKAAPTLTIQQVIALVGRALFFRFLVDRGIVAPEDATSISSRTTKLADMFQDRPTLIDTCVWLDETFNGDILSIGAADYHSLLDTVGTGIKSVSWHLGNIQHRAADGQLPLDWGGIKFRHVPVGVLSQVYEAFAHKFIPELARATSVHFTPRHLAEVIIDGVFSADLCFTPWTCKRWAPKPQTRKSEAFQKMCSIDSRASSTLWWPTHLGPA
jgi:hypothetical protein